VYFILGGNAMSDIDDAMEMLGAGYPSLEIEQERTVVSRRGGKLIEETQPAFVKISTGFKAEMRDLQPVDLKVWLYIALSVNRNTGTAWPGLRKIAEDCKLAVNTVRDAIERLEDEHGLLTVNRKEGASSIYTPSDYVSANHSTVSKSDTPAPTVSKNKPTVSNSAKTVSARRQEIAQPEEPEKQERAARNQSIKTTITKADATIDAILQNEHMASTSWQGREKLPPAIRDLADEFVTMTGIKPAKRELSFWLGEISDWLSFGVLRPDVRNGIEYAQAHDFAVMTPASLTKTVRMIAAKRSQPAQGMTYEY
jgi:DNA-binding transcriptional regulator YhcF (GntR family)